MALTIEKIHAAADQIAAQGERPTLNRVRAALGGGSFSTISEAMQEWREQQSEEHALAEVQVPEAVAERVQQLQAAAWQAAMEEAERRLVAEREALHEAQEQAAGEVAEAREAVQTLETEAEELGQALTTLQNQLTDAEVLAIRETIDRDYQVEGDLRRETSMNIKRLMDLGCYRGLRHRRSLPVRGQRTHTNARTRKGPAKAIAGKKK